MDSDRMLDVLSRAANAIGERLAATNQWGLLADSDHQHHSDLAADAAGLAVLHEADFSVLSEESGFTGRSDSESGFTGRSDSESGFTGRSAGGNDSGITVVLDPLDGSTNAAHQLSWYATSLCAVDKDGPLAALVVNLVNGQRYEAVRGLGARRDGRPIAPSGATMLAESFVGISALPPRNLGWSQFRCFGAAALDLCAVADGRLDAFVDCGVDAHGVWDYLGAMLVCQEAGAVVADAWGRDLVVLEHGARRTPVGASSQSVLDQLVEARAEAYEPMKGQER